MKATRCLGYALAIAAVIGAAIGCGYLADEHNRIVDISRAGRNSLDVKSETMLDLFDGELKIAAIVPTGHPARQPVANFFARYQRHKSDLTLTFIDPQVDFKKAQEYAANLGEIVIAFGNRWEIVTHLTEPEVTNALAKLARSSDRYVTFLSSNGERHISRQANHDLAIFAARLAKRGLKVREYALGSTRDVPDNTAVLVIASPRVAYSDGELEVINRFVAGGGNMLWLSDPDRPSELTHLDSAIGVTQLPGTVVDGIGWVRHKQPAYAVTYEYPPHITTTGFHETVVFPYAAALLAHPNVDWVATPLAATGTQAWTETGPFAGNIAYDDADEIQGALTLAVALTKQLPGREQRIVVVGDGDFLSNTFVENSGNLELGRRLVEWLASDDELIDIAVAEVADVRLDLAMWQRLVIFVVFGVGLPLSLAANGVLYWWRRRRA